MKKKMTLDQLKVNSFITSIELKNKLRGGADEPTGIYDVCKGTAFNCEPPFDNTTRATVRCTYTTSGTVENCEGIGSGAITCIG